MSTAGESYFVFSEVFVIMYSVDTDSNISYTNYADVIPGGDVI